MASLAQFEALAAALEDYERAEKVARFLRTMEGFRNEDLRYVLLVNRAQAVGYAPNLTETCLEWSRRQVASWRRHFPTHAAEFDRRAIERIADDLAAHRRTAR
jgi:hypothetical protein